MIYIVTHVLPTREGGGIFILWIGHPHHRQITDITLSIGLETGIGNGMQRETTFEASTSESCLR